MNMVLTRLKISKELQSTMRNTRYRRAQRARIRQRRLNQYLARMSGFALMIPVEEFKVTKSFKIAIDTPKNCSCEMCDKYSSNSVKNLKKQEQSFLKINGIESQLKELQPSMHNYDY